MKRLSLLLLLTLPAMAFAQSTVSASDIVGKINRGEAVTYSNARIEGNLDLTQLDNKAPKKDVAQKEKDNHTTKEYISTVNVPLSFNNCTFTGKVLAYFNPDNGKPTSNKNEVYNTNFAAAVKFEGCKFEQEAEFKYSEFKAAVSFAGSTFGKPVLFKYSNFSTAPDFSKTSYADEAVFKYVNFPAATSFAGATFNGDADFKYAKFSSGANLSRAVFSKRADFKYSEFRGNPNLKGITFNGESDFKYTTVDGEKASLIEKGR